jgi:hypothetical protein
MESFWTCGVSIFGTESKIVFFGAGSAIGTSVEDLGRSCAIPILLVSIVKLKIKSS